MQEVLVLDTNYENIDRAIDLDASKALCGVSIQTKKPRAAPIIITPIKTEKITTNAM